MDEKTGILICPFAKGDREIIVKIATDKTTATMMPWRRRGLMRRVEEVASRFALSRFREPGIMTVRPVVLALMVDCRASVSDSAPVWMGEIPEIAASCSVVITGICPEIKISGAVTG